MIQGLTRLPLESGISRHAPVPEKNKNKDPFCQPVLPVFSLSSWRRGSASVSGVSGFAAFQGQASIA